MVQAYNSNRSEKGQSLVELAFSVLLIILIIAGIIDLGRILFTYITMRDAAQEAVVYGAIYPTASYCSWIKERAISAMGSGSISDVTVSMAGVSGDSCSTVSQTTQACSGNEIKVSIKKESFPLTMPLIGIFIGSQSVTLVAEISGTILRPGCNP